jgi:Diacylglycerol kinase catalytic domain
MTATALLVLNRSAGTGHADEFANRLVDAIRSGHRGSPEVEVALVGDHPGARAAASVFAARAPRRSLVVAAGGGGTLRAVIEGVMDVHAEPPDATVLRLAALRMGSGNVIARRLGMPLDPIEGALQIGEGFARGRVASCSVMRCAHGAEGGGTAVRHAVTMCGLGAWGRVPGDIARWRERHALQRGRAAGWVGLERVNLAEYIGFGTVRMLSATASGARCELVELDGAKRFRLLAGVALAVPLTPLPRPGITIVPRFGRAIRRPLEAGFSLRLLDRESVELFLDEDPETVYDWVKLEVAGRLAFVPGRAA